MHKCAPKVLRVCKALHAAGVRISFDPNARKELIGNPAYLEAVRDMIDIAAIFLPSGDDAATPFRGEGIARFAAKLFAGGVEYFVLKKGEHGAQGISNSGENVSPKAQKSMSSTRPERAIAFAPTKVGPMEGNSRLSEEAHFDPSPIMAAA